MPCTSTGCFLFQYNSLVSSLNNQSMMPSGQYSTTQGYMSTSGLSQPSHLKGAISNCEGPIVSSMNSSGSLQGSLSGFTSLNSRQQFDEGTIELLSHDMSFSALYMHDLRHRRLRGYDNLDDIRARALWQHQDQSTHQPISLRQDSPGSGIHMPDIQETPQEEEGGRTSDSDSNKENITKSC